MLRNVERQRHRVCVTDTHTHTPRRDVYHVGPKSISAARIPAGKRERARVRSQFSVAARSRYKTHAHKLHSTFASQTHATHNITFNRFLSLLGVVVVQPAQPASQPTASQPSQRALASASLASASPFRKRNCANLAAQCPFDLFISSLCACVCVYRAHYSIKYSAVCVCMST